MYKVQAPNARQAAEEEPPPSGVVPLHDTVAEGGKASVTRRKTGKQTEKMAAVASSLVAIPSDASNTMSDGYAPGGVVPLHDAVGHEGGKKTLTAEQKGRIEEKRLEARYKARRKSHRQQECQPQDAQD